MHLESYSVGESKRTKADDVGNFEAADVDYILSSSAYESDNLPALAIFLQWHRGARLCPGMQPGCGSQYPPRNLVIIVNLKDRRR